MWKINGSHSHAFAIIHFSFNRLVENLGLVKKTTYHSYCHENWHVTSSPTHDVTVTSSMTTLFRKCGRWFSSLDPKILLGKIFQPFGRKFSFKRLVENFVWQPNKTNTL